VKDLASIELYPLEFFPNGGTGAGRFGSNFLSRGKCEGFQFYFHLIIVELDFTTLDDGFGNSAQVRSILT
jgi:hypothetical protein